MAKHWPEGTIVHEERKIWRGTHEQASEALAYVRKHFPPGWTNHEESIEWREEQEGMPEHWLVRIRGYRLPEVGTAQNEEVGCEKE